MPFFEALFENYTNLTEMEFQLFEKIKKIFIKYLFSPRIKPINENELTNELKELNKILNMANIKNSNYNGKKSTSLKVSSSKRNEGVTGETYLINLSYKKKSKLKTLKYSI